MQGTTKEIQKKHNELFLEERFFPVGEETMFEWIVHANGKEFELSKVANNSCADIWYIDTKDFLRAIYAD